MTAASRDVLIVGAGSLGLSTAIELRRRGATVTVVDRFPAGVQTSARAAGQSVLVQSDPNVASLMRRSIERFIEYADEYQDRLRVYQVGSLKLALSNWAATQIDREIQGARAVGTTVEEVDLGTAATIAPHIDVSTVQRAWFTPEELYFQPTEMLAALVSSAERAGVRILSGISVQGFEKVGDRVVGVRTTDGVIQADRVVVTAGGWGPRLLATAGGALERLPVSLVRHQLTVRGPIPGIRRTLPLVRVIDHAVYSRPDSDDTLVFGTYEPDPRVYEAGDIPDDLGDLPLDSSATQHALEAVGAVFPSVRDAPMLKLRGGVVTMTPDGGYIVDEAPDSPGLFFLTGCNVRGLSVSPALGEGLAEWVSTGTRPESLEPYRLDRFDQRVADDSELARARQEGIDFYGSIYQDEESRAVTHGRHG